MNVIKYLLRNVIEWLTLSVITFLLYWFLWYIVDRNAYEEDGYSLNVVLFDFNYCCSFTLCVIIICKSIFGLLSGWISRRWVFLLASISSIILNVLMAHLFEYFQNQWYFENLRRYELVEGLYIYSLIATILSIILLSNHHYKLYVEEIKKHKRNELALLKQQLDPHFLFNNLNTLDALIEEDTDTAHRYLAKLSHIYRFVIKHINVDSIEIGEAISFTKSYVNLLQISNPNHIILHIDEFLLHNTNHIFPMAIQLLVENVIKHNKHSSENPINIEIRQIKDYIVVSNTFRPIRQAIQSTNIGLENLNKHCQYITGKECIISQSNDLFEVKIPIIKKTEI